MVRKRGGGPAGIIGRLATWEEVSTPKVCKTSRKFRVDRQVVSGPASVVEASLTRMDDARRQSSFADDAARELSSSIQHRDSTPTQTAVITRRQYQTN